MTSSPDRGGGTPGPAALRDPEREVVRPLFESRPRRSLAGLSQIGAVVAGAVLGVLVPHLPVGPLIGSPPVVDLLLTVGFGVLGLVSLLFSLMFLVVQWGASTFTPRLRLFRSDPLIWRVFGLAVGLFSYSLTAALALDPEAPARGIVPAVAMIIVVVTLALMRSLQLRAFRSLQLAPNLAAVSAAGLELVDRAYPRTCGRTVPGAGLEGRTVTWTGGLGVLQRLELPDLVVAADRADAAVEFSAPVGAVLWPGKAVAVVRGDGLADAAITSAVVVGIERSFDQDPALAFSLLADIGLRALSSSVNDPGTAVQVLDTLEPMLGDAGTRDLVASGLHGASGRLRVTVPQPTWEDLIVLSLDDIIVCAARSPMVLSRLVALLSRLRATVRPERADVIGARLDYVRAQLGSVRPFLDGLAPDPP